MLDRIKHFFFKHFFKRLNRNQRLAYTCLRTTTVDRTCIICVSRDVERELTRRSWSKYNRGYTKRIRLGGKWVCLLKCGVGTPDCNFNLRALYYAGARTLIRADVCGGLKSHIGDVIIARDAVPLDAYTSRLGYKYPIKGDPNLIRIATDIVANRFSADAYRVGRVITVDEFFEQSGDDIEMWSKMGIALDMETSTLYRSAKELGIPAISIMCVSDVPYSPENIFEHPEKYPIDRYKEGIKNLIDLSAELIRAI